MIAKKNILLTLLIVILVFSASLFAEEPITFKDPIGDDNGPGNFTYPTDPVYTAGSFDLTKVVIKDKGSTVEISITVNATLENPWSMASGFSTQQAFVFIDMDGQPNSGHALTLPGLNAAFAPECYWEKAIVISPQPMSKVLTEVKTKAGDAAKDVIVPIQVVPRGKTFIALIKKEDLGADVSAQWGWQVLLTSNEGFPGPNEILTRRVNEYEGQHRFGGGDDYDGDPHFMDMLCAPGTGSDAEKETQHKIMAQYVSGADPSAYVYVKLPMLYAGKTVEIAAPVASEAPAVPVVAVARPAAGPSSAFGLKTSGKLFTNFMHGNDTSQFSNLSGGEGGHNGIVSEIEFNLLAKVSKYAEVGLRISSRFRNNFWATYWNNDNLEKAQLMKLRGIWGQFRTPDWMQGIVDNVLLGSSDLGMFSPWTIGRLRYIDRDNAAGIFFAAKVAKWFNYDLARISLPSLWAGPGWTTGGSADDATGRAFINRDYAYGANLRFPVSPNFNFRLIGYYSKDVEGDSADTNPRNGKDFKDRFENTVLSVEFDAAPITWLQLSGMFTSTKTDYNAQNYTQDWGGWNSMPAKDLSDTAYKLTAQFDDPFHMGLSFGLEYFNVGEDYLSVMASRREQDVLLTEGFEGDDMSGRYNLISNDERWRYGYDWASFNGTCGQSPSAIADNSELQFDEMAYESIIGWKGLTALASYGRDTLDLSLEYTTLDYNSNGQGRDMTLYPVNLRIWNQNQDRKTTIALLKLKYTFNVIGITWDFSGKAKYIKDEDGIDITTTADDYSSKKWIYDLGLGAQVANEVYLKLGYTVFDDDMSRGITNLPNKKNRLYFMGKYNFGGIKIGYIGEKYTGNDWLGGVNYDDWKLLRCRAFLEIAF